MRLEHEDLSLFRSSKYDPGLIEIHLSSDDLIVLSCITHYGASSWVKELDKAYLILGGINHIHWVSTQADNLGRAAWEARSKPSVSLQDCEEALWISEDEELISLAHIYYKVSDSNYLFWSLICLCLNLCVAVLLHNLIKVNYCGLLWGSIVIDLKKRLVLDSCLCIFLLLLSFLLLGNFLH